MCQMWPGIRYWAGQWLEGWIPGSRLKGGERGYEYMSPWWKWTSRGKRTVGFCRQNVAVEVDVGWTGGAEAVRLRVAEGWALGYRRPSQRPKSPVKSGNQEVMALWPEKS